ncbi:hypothetical protein HDU97_002102 [Phlyctochytrium planicorne]|nr:hypothetical protein HDU97_002102 [Phlyctochytrium planicorne]
MYQHPSYTGNYGGGGGGGQQGYGQQGYEAQQGYGGYQQSQPVAPNRQSSAPRLQNFGPQYGNSYQQGGLAPPPHPGGMGGVGRMATVYGGRGPRTIARKGGNYSQQNYQQYDSVERDIDDSYMAALICALFPLTAADAPSGPVAAQTAPPLASGSLGSNSHLQQFLGNELASHLGALNLNNILNNSIVDRDSKIMGDKLKLSGKTLEDFRTRVRQKAEILRLIPKVDHNRHFAVAGVNFVESGIKTQELSDLGDLLFFLGSLVDSQVRIQNLEPSEHDSTFLKSIDLFLNIIRESLNNEKNSRAALEHPFLKDRAEKNPSVRAHFAKFMQDTKAIQSTDKTPMADWLRVVYNLPIEEHLAKVARARNITGDRVSVGHLDRYIKELESSNVRSAPQSDFSTKDAYEMWRKRELAIMTGFRAAMQLKYPNITPMDDTTTMFSPPKAHQYYQILLKKCYEHDINSSGGNVQLDKFEFSKASKLLLSECGQRWQLSKDWREMALYDHFINAFNENKLMLSSLVPKIEPVFSLAKDVQLMRLGDIKFLIKSLESLTQGVLGILKNFTELVKGDPHISRTTLKQVAEILRNINSNNAYRIYSDKFIDNVPLTIVETLQGALVKRFTELEKEAAGDSTQPDGKPIARDETDDLYETTAIVKLVADDMEKFGHHFPDPLLETIRVRVIVEEIYMRFFAIKIENLRTLFKNIEKFSIDDVLGPHGLYQEVSNLFSKLEPDTVRKVNFNAEEFFRPFIVEWLSVTDAKWQNWVFNSIRADNYKPIMPPTAMYSSSVRDIFTFFNNGLMFMKRLDGINPTKKEDLYLLFIKVTCRSLEYYKDCILEGFEKMQNDNSDRAMDFSHESCMQLNNVMGASLQLKFIFDELGIAERRGQINPNAARRDEKPGHHQFKIAIVRAYDLQICDFTTSDPYVKIMSQEHEMARTKTINKNLNPVWDMAFDVMLPENYEESYSFLRFEVWDEDNGFDDDVCGVARKSMYLRDSKYADFLYHEEEYELSPQGRLKVRVRRIGEIDDVDYWVIRSRQLLDISAEQMVSIFVDRIVRFTNAEWNRIVEKFTSKTFFMSFQTIPMPTEEQVEESMKPIFAYLDKCMGLFNETLDRPLLNEFIRKTYPFLLEGNRLDGSRQNLNDQDKVDKELSSPSFICLVIWNELCQKLFQQLSEFGAGRNVGVKKTRTVYGGKGDKQASAQKPLNDTEKKQVLVYELILEYLKAFFYCEVDGSHYGFKLDQLENRAYMKARDLIEGLGF